MTDVMTDEELKALVLLTKNRRLMLILVPENAPDEFVARLTAWSNFCLDTKLIPPLWLPVAKQGDGLVCPYCAGKPGQHLDFHEKDCEWRKAAERWGGAQLQIDEEFGTTYV
jgi:hypothetical protein